jgi:hypothetical protein
MPSETTRPQDETRTINVTGQRLRVAIRPGIGTRTPLLLMNGIGINLEVLQQFVAALVYWLLMISAEQIASFPHQLLVVHD